jgi:hypothetical protein
MFFRRAHPKTVTVAERLDALRQAGFTVEAAPGGGARVARDGCAALVNETGIAGRAGLVMGAEIGSLVDGGFQKFFRAPSGKSRPALAEELKALHDFEEDLRQALGLTSLYNESLGTVSTFYDYDRLEGRE